MEINGYEIRFDPIGLDETWELQSDVKDVPYGDVVIYDKVESRSGYTFDLVLVNDEIESIVGMISRYHLIHILYKHFDGWFFVTSIEESWMKDIEGMRLISFKVSGLYIGNHHLTVGTYQMYQKTDFDLIPFTNVRIPPTSYTSKITPTTSISTSGTRGDLPTFVDEDNLIHFMATRDIFYTGLNITTLSSGKQIFTTQSPTENVNIDNGIINISSIVGTPSSNSLKIYDSSSTEVVSLTTTDMDCENNERTVSPGQFKTTLRQRYAEYTAKYGMHHIRIDTPVEDITVPTRRLIIPIAPDVEPGAGYLHTDDPTGFPIDTSGYNVSGQDIRNLHSPGHLYYDPTSPTTSYILSCPFLQERTRYQIPASDEPWYIGRCTPELIFGDFDSWTKSSGTWNEYTNGNTYYGPTNYWQGDSSSATNTMYKNISLPTNGIYDVWLLASRLSIGVDVGFTLDINSGGFSETGTLPVSYSTTASWIYFGAYSLSSGSNLFTLSVPQSIGGRFYEYLIIPRSGSEGDSSYEVMMDAIGDMNTSFEIV